MAMEHGTANSQAELYGKLISFLTENPTLVAAEQAWEVVWTRGEDLIVSGPGLSAQDSVYVGFNRFENVAVDSRAIQFRGMAGVLGDSIDLAQHVVVQPSPVLIFTDTQEMEYWFVANGRRFIVILKISTIFQAAYCGLFLPYANPISYPYPLYVGGAAMPFRNNTNSPINWRSTSNGFRNFWTPFYSTSGSLEAEATAWAMNPMGEWARISFHNTPGDWVQLGGLSVGSTSLLRPGTVDPFFYPEEDFVLDRLKAAYGNEYALIPITLAQRSPTGQTMGILDGVYRCQGQDNASQNIITKDGVDHLVVQNTFRTGIGDYAAIVLE